MWYGNGMNHNEARALRSAQWAIKRLVETDDTLSDEMREELTAADTELEGMLVRAARANSRRAG